MGEENESMEIGFMSFFYGRNKNDVKLFCKMQQDTKAPLISSMQKWNKDRLKIWCSCKCESTNGWKETLILILANKQDKSRVKGPTIYVCTVHSKWKIRAIKLQNPKKIRCFAACNIQWIDKFKALHLMHVVLVADSMNNFSIENCHISPH